ncbi:MAG: tetratricopeptide repeat protein [Candidatus Sumerlaeaceae bacterium]
MAERKDTVVAQSVRATTWAATVLFAVVPAILKMISAQETYSVRFSDFAAQQRRNSSAIATILGEFRTNLSDMLFIKTERYLHGGVAYMPHIDAEKLAASGNIEHMKSSSTEPGHGTDTATSSPALREHETSKTAGEEHDHGHEHLATLIRTPKNDFRGFLGDLERQVKPWRDPRLPHQHIGGVELLPWYRLATLVDPKNVRAYMIGAWWLKTLHNEKALREAVKFVEDGLQHNKTAFQLELMRGYLLRELGEKKEALQAFDRAVELVKRQRPKDGAIGKTWTIYNEEDTLAACSMSALTRRELAENDAEGIRAALERVIALKNEFDNMPALDRLERSLKAQLQALEKQ